MSKTPDGEEPQKDVAAGADLGRSPGSEGPPVGRRDSRYRPRKRPSDRTGHHLSNSQNPAGVRIDPAVETGRNDALRAGDQATEPSALHLQCVWEQRGIPIAKDRESDRARDQRTWL